MNALVEVIYIVAAVFFILGIKRLSSPRTARSGNIVGSVGMLLAIVATLIAADLVSWWGILLGVAIGTVVGVMLAYMVKMTAMPQMVAMLNGFGGAASALVATAEYMRLSGGTNPVDNVVIEYLVVVVEV